MLTMDKAKLIIEAAVEKAMKLGQPMNIAIVDAGTNLVAFPCLSWMSGLIGYRFEALCSAN